MKTRLVHPTYKGHIHHAYDDLVHLFGSVPGLDGIGYNEVTYCGVFVTSLTLWTVFGEHMTVTCLVCIATQSRVSGGC